MRLLTKGLIFISLLAVLFALNFLFGMRAIRELKVTNELTSQDYEVTLRVQQTRLALFDYYNSGLLAAFTDDKEKLQRFLKHRQDLRGVIERDWPKVPGSELKAAFDKLEETVRNLLVKEQKQSESDSDLTHLREIFLSPTFQKHLAQIQADLGKIVVESGKFVAADREWNDLFYRRTFLLFVFIFSFSLIVLMQRLWYLRRDIFVPIQEMIDVIEKVRLGDLNVKFNIERSDEIGTAGRTINRMIEELQQRRRERVEFVSSIVHDLKNPLTALNLNCDLALRIRNKISKDEAIKVIERVKGHVDRLIRLTDDLLLSTQGNHPTWEMRISSFDLATLAQEIIDVFKSSHPDHKYVLVKKGGSTELNADRDRMGQVLSNLISNATKYSDPGTSIEVRVGAIDSGIFLEVQDQGVGIPDEKKKLIFERFIRLESGERMSVGTGLGLAIVKDIVHFHFGSISVHDGREGGTVFSITLPRHHPSKHGLAASTDLPSSKKNIDHLHSVS